MVFLSLLVGDEFVIMSLLVFEPNSIASQPCTAMCSCMFDRSVRCFVSRKSFVPIMLSSLLHHCAEVNLPYL